ncbi:MAG: alpha/beta hydrolase [Caldilinea sp. CFX5]|nr:alpha/beta hydrolase [Caldilinea sp. CFX5]
MTTVQTGFADLNEATIYYEVAGTGEPLILVHAGICDARMWDEQFAFFAQSYRVVRYDQRGYGQTPAVDGPFAHYQDLYALLQHLGITQTYLVGCSMGGSACLDFALAYPAMVNRLILVGSTPGGYKAHQPWPAQIEAVNSALNEGNFEQAAELEVQIWVDGVRRTPDQAPATIRDRVRTMDTIALQNEMLDLGQLEPLAPPAAERLHELLLPTLLLVGDLDQPRIREAIDFMTERLPNGRKVIMPGTAHLPNMEQPQRFNKLVLDFLGSGQRRT